MSTIRILALVRDLMLRSRIEAAAAALGAEVVPAATLELAGARAVELAPTVVFADLSDIAFPAAATAAAMRAAAPAARLVGFAAHVDLKSLKSARDAGFDLTLSRSEFTERLPHLIKAQPSRA